MFHSTVQYGKFRLMLCSYTPGASAYLADFLNHLPQNINLVNTPTSDARLTLVAPESLGDLSGEEKLWRKLVQAWNAMESSWTGTSLLSLDSKKGPGHPAEFIYLIPRGRELAEVRARLGMYVVRTKERWLIQQGWLPLHAAAVERLHRGYLFLGESGAGKTTVTRLSREIADSILNDERVFIKDINGGYFLMAANNFSHLAFNFVDGSAGVGKVVLDQIPTLKSDHIVPLAGIFVLKKDGNDFILPSSKLSTAQAVLKGFLESAIDIISTRKELEGAFHSLCRTASRIPGYELHFRKSSDFWKLIDERFAG